MSTPRIVLQDDTTPTTPELYHPSRGPGVTVVIPCLNESATIAEAVEVIVADNGSTDGSARLARATGARVVSVPERGYGAASVGQEPAWFTVWPWRLSWRRGCTTTGASITASSP
jgi:hypothetical protein